MDIACLPRHPVASTERTGAAFSTCVRKARESLICGYRALPIKDLSAVELLKYGAFDIERELESWAEDGSRGRPMP